MSAEAAAGRPNVHLRTDGGGGIYAIVTPTAPQSMPTEGEGSFFCGLHDAGILGADCACPTDHEAKAGARALREAADEWPEDGMTRSEAQRWLSDRAAALDAEGEGRS